MINYFEHDVLEQRKPFDKEYRIVRINDGVERWVHGLGKLHVDESGAPIRMFGTIRDITDRVVLEQRARQSEKEALRRRYLRRVIEAQEEERRRIARELHDEAGQSLTSIAVRLATLDAAKSLDDVHREVAILREIVGNVANELTRLSHGLQPHLLADLGFDAAVQWLADDFEKQYGKHVVVESVGDGTRRPLNEWVATIGYRIVQEALTNVAKHAHANTVSVVVRHESDRLAIQVEDDGAGFDPTAQTTNTTGMGLFGIRERVELLHGTMDIESDPGAGTTLTVRLPLEWLGASDD